MLRPATPLTAMLFAAFALLLISVLSTPIITAIPLASFGGISFGVFGYCQQKQCSKIEIGYNTANLGYTVSESASFNLPTSTRTTLSAILVIHPVACLFTLIMFILAATAHFRSPSHSPRYLLGLFILSILTLLLTLLSFLIDLLLFVPHLAWGTYLVLVATILTAASGVVSCAMRRTLVSRKARARRIAENAEMSGENFYNRQAAEAAATIPPVPPSNNAQGGDELSSFAAYDFGTKMDGARTSDERIPLTSRTPTERSQDGSHRGFNGPIRPGGLSERGGMNGGMNGRMNGGMNGGMDNGRFNSPRPRDESNNPLPPPGVYGPPGMRGWDSSQDRMQNPYLNSNPRGRGGPPSAYRGRGGQYYPGGRGVFNQNMRGGYGGPGFGRGGMNGRMVTAAPVGMRGGRGPLPGFGQPIDRGPSPSSAYVGYQPPGPNGPYRDEQRGLVPFNGGGEGDGLPRAESPPPLPGVDEAGPIGQALEMDATTGSPSHQPPGFGTNANGIRDSDSEVAGLVGLQQAKLERHDTVQSVTSRYSTDEPYVPPRQAWAGQDALGRVTPPNPITKASGTSNLRRQSSDDNYYEDVDPRFAEHSLVPNKPQTLPLSSATPPSLIPGYLAPNAIPPNREPINYLNPNSSNSNYAADGIPLDGNNSYENIHEGTRSPAESDRSNFTSVSQRGVNPRWNAQTGPAGYGNSMPNRRPFLPAGQRNDMLLASNPDFELPGARPGWMGGRR